MDDEQLKRELERLAARLGRIEQRLGLPQAENVDVAATVAAQRSNSTPAPPPIAGPSTLHHRVAVEEKANVFQRLHQGRQAPLTQPSPPAGFAARPAAPSAHPPVARPIAGPPARPVAA